jgi:hypothetical protein
MVKSIHGTFGTLKTLRKGHKIKTKFEQALYGEDIEIFIEFDNGTSKGYCKLEELQTFITEFIRIHERL